MASDNSNSLTRSPHHPNTRPTPVGRPRSTPVRMTPMAEMWMSYAELGTALGITAEAVRQKAIRARWRRQRDNSGKAQVLVDVEEVRATLKPPRERVSDTRTEQPD